MAAKKTQWVKNFVPRLMTWVDPQNAPAGERTESCDFLLISLCLVQFTYTHISVCVCTHISEQTHKWEINKTLTEVSEKVVMAIKITWMDFSVSWINSEKIKLSYLVPHTKKISRKRALKTTKIGVKITK